MSPTGRRLMSLPQSRSHWFTRSPAASFCARRALEFVVAWLYKAEPALTLPYQDNLAKLLSGPSFTALSTQGIVPMATCSGLQRGTNAQLLVGFILAKIIVQYASSVLPASYSFTPLVSVHAHRPVTRWLQRKISTLYSNWEWYPPANNHSGGQGHVGS